MSEAIKCDECGVVTEKPVLNVYEPDKKYCPRCGSEI